MNDENPESRVDAPVPGGSSQELDASEIPETDIVFECPHCGKSLSIDQRGAGLVIRCTQCAELVSVPIPDGMELDDFDATPEELSAQLLHTRQTLAKAQARIEKLEGEVAALRAYRDDVQASLRANADTVHRLEDAFNAGFAALEDAHKKFREAGELANEAIDLPDDEEE